MAAATTGSSAAVMPQELKALQHPVGWAVATATVVLLAKELIRPTPCTEDASCTAQHATIPTNFNAYTACGLVMVLINEVTSLVSIFYGAKEAQALVSDLKSRYMPSLLMTMMFVVLVAQHSLFAWYSHPWFASARPDGRGPVYNLTYLEWLLTVPLLLTISGHCALGRPLEEMARPVIVTNVYIVCSWAALMTSSPVVKCGLVLLTFIMYFHASSDMVMWVVKYFRETPEDLPSRFLRPCLSLGLIALFAIYAVIYLSVMTGLMEMRTERFCWLVLDVGSKLAMSAAFVVIRGSAYHKTLTGVLKKMSTSNVAVVSILRGSFDVLLPCTVDKQEKCWLPRTSVDDMLRLEGTLQRPVAGQHLANLLADDVQRENFNAYVRNALRQAEQPKGLSDAVVSARGEWSIGGVQGQLPPVAQVLNCRMATGLSQEQGAATVGCSIHLSVVPQSAMSFGLERRVVAAVRFAEVESAEEPQEAKLGSFETFDPSKEEVEEPEPDIPVADLKDVARLGLSALLAPAQSVASAADEEGGSSYYTTSQTLMRRAAGEKWTPPTEGTAVVEEEPEPSVAGTELERRKVARQEWDEDSASSVSDFLGLKASKVAREAAVKPKKFAAGSLAGSSIAETETEENLSSHNQTLGDIGGLRARKPASEASFTKQSVSGSSVAETENGAKTLSSTKGSTKDTLSRHSTEDLQNILSRLSTEEERAASKVQEKEHKPVEFSGESTETQDLSEARARSNVTMTVRLDPMQLSIAVGTMALAAVAMLRR